jgi:methylated-DNA-[protein]-cysteine S-methyltransferase
MKTHLVEIPIATPNGEFIARYSEKGLAELNFPKNGRAALRRRPAEPQLSPTISNMSAMIRSWHLATESALKEILAGSEPTALPPLDWTGATEFQKSVWREMLKISAGKTKSYGDIARAIGNPKAVRAVGGACGANPIPVLVPCHRVLAANKKIGGFSSGLDWKRRLLKTEGIEF